MNPITNGPGDSYDFEYDRREERDIKVEARANMEYDRLLEAAKPLAQLLSGREGTIRMMEIEAVLWEYAEEIANKEIPR